MQISLPQSVVADVARALLRAGAVADAKALAAVGASVSPRLALVMIEADIADAYLAGRAPSVEVFQRHQGIVEDDGSDEDRWDLELLAVRLDFIAQIFEPGTVLASMKGRDPGRVDALRARVEALRESSPDARREGWANFYLGVTYDNLYGERGAAPRFYELCLAAALETSDHVLRYEALRHLGDHRNDEGNPHAARAMWEESAASAARAGAVTSTLSQLILLAELAHDRGDGEAGRLLAGEVGRWADSLGAVRLREQARAVVARGGGEG